MPRYNPQALEPKWMKFWDEHETFKTPNTPPAESKGKMYVLDMFPYPSGAGLHVGHPEGYTATDIVVRFNRMQGKHVLHPMGWDAFGLPAEQYAIETGTHPRVTTYKNIDTFRSQLKMLGFSYDWSRELSTTDPDYFKWTQWIFLEIYDTWYDAEFTWTAQDGKTRKGKGRPISELPIPAEVKAQGAIAVRKYQDAHRLAFQDEAPVNWCPALGTVLANEEVTAEGRSDRGNHPVERRPLRQWKLRITTYAERLLDELDDVDWPESVKLLQRNWIGRSVGAEVDFYIPRRAGGVNPLSPTSTDEFHTWKTSRQQSGYPKTPPANVLRVYTTRPDTLYGATYMVIAPEHPLIDSLTTPDQKAAVEAYCTKVASKTDLDRTDLAKEKSGVFTGSYAINPVSGQPIPIWTADYVLMGYGTGAIMAVPAHDERDYEFAVTFNLPIIEVVEPANKTLPLPQGEQKNIPPLPLGEGRGEGSPFKCFSGEGLAINSYSFNGTPTAEFKTKIIAHLAEYGLGKEAVNYRLRDWLFSRQRYWGEPFPLWHELDAEGNLTGLCRPVDVCELPVNLPDMEDFKPKGTPDPPLNHAPADWLYKTLPDGTRLKRETNSMPQWAGSCWYYLRFADNKNSQSFIDPEVEKYWLPVDLYIGGAEHAVLHLLYSRFWHKILFDRGHVSKSEPFQKLVNQGMILGEMEHTLYETAEKQPVSAKDVIDLPTDYPDSTPKPAGLYILPLPPGEALHKLPLPPGEGRGEGSSPKTHTVSKAFPVFSRRLPLEEVTKKGEHFVLKANEEIILDSRSFKMSKSRGNVINPNSIVEMYGADSLRLYEMFMGPLEQTKPWSMTGVEGVYRFLGRVWRMFIDERDESMKLHPAIQDIPLTTEQERFLHKTIKGVTDDIEKLSFNTVISKLMEFTNEFGTTDSRPRALVEPFILLLAPLAPFIAEEIWQALGNQESLTYTPWPKYDPAKLIESEVEIPVQVNGKLRAKIKVPVDADAAAMQAIVSEHENVKLHLEGKTILKVVAIPGKMLNFVVK